MILSTGELGTVRIWKGGVLEVSISQATEELFVRELLSLSYRAVSEAQHGEKDPGSGGEYHK